MDDDPTDASVVPGGWRPTRATGAAVGRAATTVAVGAAQAGRAATRRTLQTVTDFGAGIWCFWRGLGRFLTSPTLWFYAAIPVAALFLIFEVVTEAAMAGVDAVVAWAMTFTDSWPDWLNTVLAALMHWSALLAVHSLLSFLVLPLSLVLGSVFYVLLARRVERRLGGAPAERPGLLAAAGVAIRQAVLLTLLLHFGWLLLAPLLWVPGLNAAVALTAVVLFNGFLVGVVVLAIPLHHHGTASFGAQLRAVWRCRASVIGFGGMSLLMLSIPFEPMRVLVAPIVFTGAVLLHRRMLVRLAQRAVADTALATR